jgi:hypothetical protein
LGLTAVLKEDVKKKDTNTTNEVQQQWK